MFNLTKNIYSSSLNNNYKSKLILNILFNNLNNNKFHTTNLNFDKKSPAEKEVKKFMKYNDIMYPPQKENEERRPAFVCHYKDKIKYSHEKMWYVACFVRGMSVDEAITQLAYVNKKGATYVRDTILEAQELALKEHNVEYKTNLWVAESFSLKDIVIRGIRRHARGRMGNVEYKYCSYFVRLEEGKPPKNYYWTGPQSGPEKLQEYLKLERYRKISTSL